MSLRLYSYCLRCDAGVAPNPFWGLCTLVICKPAIRRTAKVGDWVLGTGSVDSPAGDLAGRAVYVMQVTDVLSMREYEIHIKKHLRDKLPDLANVDPRRRAGDCIYDFRTKPPRVRPSDHTKTNRPRDLTGCGTLTPEGICVNSTTLDYCDVSTDPTPRRLLSLRPRTRPTGIPRVDGEPAPRPVRLRPGRLRKARVAGLARALLRHRAPASSPP